MQNAEEETFLLTVHIHLSPAVIWLSSYILGLGGSFCYWQTALDIQTRTCIGSQKGCYIVRSRMRLKTEMKGHRFDFYMSHKHGV